MTSSYTDEQLNAFNQDYAVYSVNSGFAKRKSKKIVVDKADDELEGYETNTIDVSGQQFKVIKTLSDPGTGFDGMAVAPVVNGEPDLKNVAVVAAGTESGNLVDLVGAAGTRFATLSPQYEVADGFLQDVMDMPDVRVTQLTGYSQGSYVLKSGAKYHIPTTVFNGWFDYNALSDEEKQYMQAFPHLFRNYRKKSDNVVSLLDGNEPRKHYKHFDDYGTITWFEGSSHNITDWYFDKKTGQILTKKDGKVVKFKSTAAGYASSLLSMTYLKKLKSHWKETGGGLSDSEKIFLDAAQGYALGGAMASVARTRADEVETLAKSANQEVADIWSEVDFSSYSALDPYEVRSLFDSLGVSQEKIVDKFQEFTQKKTSKMSELAGDFETLNQSFQQTIQEIEARDQTLAEDFRAWMK